MTYRQRMESLMTHNDNHIEANDFIKREISTWGDEYVDDLFDKGYTIVKLSNGKWSWLLTDAAISAATLTTSVS